MARRLDAFHLPQSPQQSTRPDGADSLEKTDG